MFNLSLKRSFRRQALTKPNMLYCWQHYIANARRTIRARATTHAYPDALPIGQEIMEQGVVVGSSEKFLSDFGQQALAEAAESVLGLSRSSRVQAVVAKGVSEYKKDYLVNLIPWEYEHSPDSPLVKLALDRKLLEIVSSYLDLWPRLHAIGAWLNFPAVSDAKDAQLWHRDPEDLRLIKAFIYLVDVDESRGPFCYIPKTHPFSAGAAKVPEHKDKKRITDQEMAEAFPRETWLNCVGPAKTMILADTVGYHRGGKPADGNRILITFTYTSGTPLSDRRLKMSSSPTWLMDDIQRYALR